MGGDPSVPCALCKNAPCSVAELTATPKLELHQIGFCQGMITFCRNVFALNLSC